MCLGRKTSETSCHFSPHPHQTACSQDDLSLLIFPVTWLRQCSLGFSTMKSFFVPLFPVQPSDGSPCAQTTLRESGVLCKSLEFLHTERCVCFLTLMYVSLDLLVGVNIDSSVLTSYSSILIQDCFVAQTISALVTGSSFSWSLCPFVITVTDICFFSTLLLSEVPSAS